MNLSGKNGSRIWTWLLPKPHSFTRTTPKCKYTDRRMRVRHSVMDQTVGFPPLKWKAFQEKEHNQVVLHRLKVRKGHLITSTPPPTTGAALPHHNSMVLFHSLELHRTSGFSWSGTVWWLCKLAKLKSLASVIPLYPIITNKRDNIHTHEIALDVNSCRLWNTSYLCSGNSHILIWTQKNGY